MLTNAGIWFASKFVQLHQLLKMLKKHNRLRKTIPGSAKINERPLAKRHLQCRFESPKLRVWIRNS